MTETSKSIDSLASYLRIWADALTSVLGQIAGPQFAGQSFTVELPEASPLETAASDTSSAPVESSTPESAAAIFLNTTLAGTLRGEQALGLSVQLSSWLAQTFVGELVAEGAAESPAELSTNHREAVEELFRQIAGVAATALKSKWGEVKIHIQAGEAPTWPSAMTATIRGGYNSDATQVPLAIEVRISAALAAAIRSAEETAAKESMPTETPARAVASSAPANAAANPSHKNSGCAPDEVNLDLLQNVPLDLTLRFGQRRMLLREILELGPGSVIELDRRLKEPVDLLLDGRVLARGEVVVIQGYYGLRVTEVAAAGEVER